MNIVVLNGRLTKDPELKFGQSGTAYCNFDMAVDRAFTSGDKKEADFIHCVAFGKTAEFVGEYFRKGRKILVNGSLRQERWESNGENKSTYKVYVLGVEFGDSKPKDTESNEKEDLRGYANTGTDVADDEFPF